MLIEVLKDSLSSVNTHGPARFIFVTGYSEQWVYRMFLIFCRSLKSLEVPHEVIHSKRRVLIGMTAVCFVLYETCKQAGFDDGLDKTRISFHHDHYSGG